MHAETISEDFDLNYENLNKYLFENNIYLNHLVKRKSSLEDQFLELTKNK